MKPAENLWKNDVGFLWMLAIALLTLVSTQLPTGVILENKFILRLSFFLFTFIAIKSSALPAAGKILGYAIASILLLLAIAIIRIESQGLILLYTVFTTGYMIFILALVITQIFASGTITVNKIGGGIAAYILMGHLWASLYLTVYIVQPASFQHGGELIQEGEALKHLSYFSFVTLTTIGYGDIVAIGSLARILVMLEGLMGQLFPAIFIAKLVTLQIDHSRKL
jgi:Ion channel